jgi:hypothetical protein
MTVHDQCSEEDGVRDMERSYHQQKSDGVFRPGQGEMKER